MSEVEIILQELGNLVERFLKFHVAPIKEMFKDISNFRNVFHKTFEFGAE